MQRLSTERFNNLIPKNSIPYEMFSEGLRSEKFRSSVFSLWENVAQEWLTNFKTELLTELRAYGAELKSNFKPETCISVFFKNHLKKWFENQTLSPEQQKDLVYFNKNKAGVPEAIYYVIAWQSIEHIYDKNSANDCVCALTRISQIQNLSETFHDHLVTCLNKLNVKNLYLCPNPYSQDKEIASIISTEIKKLNSNEQEKYATEYHKNYLEILNQYTLFYEHKKATGSNFRISPNLNSNLSLSFLTEFFSDKYYLDQACAASLVRLHANSGMHPYYQEIDTAIIFEIDLHLAILKQINETAYKDVIQQINSELSESIYFANIDLENKFKSVKIGKRL